MRRTAAERRHAGSRAYGSAGHAAPGSFAALRKLPSGAGGTACAPYPHGRRAPADRRSRAANGVSCPSHARSGVGRENCIRVAPLVPRSAHALGSCGARLGCRRDCGRAAHAQVTASRAFAGRSCRRHAVGHLARAQRCPAANPGAAALAGHTPPGRNLFPDSSTYYQGETQMKSRLFYLFAIVFLVAAMARAQQPAPEAHPQPQPQANPDPFARNFYPPDLIMQNQEALQLTDEQESYFKTEMRKAQMNFTELQWKLQDEAEKLMKVAKAQHVDEQQLLAQLEKLLNAERDVKRAQITLLVHIKNKLTPAQQAVLDNLRRTRSAAPEARPEGE